MWSLGAAMNPSTRNDPVQTNRTSSGVRASTSTPSHFKMFCVSLRVRDETSSVTSLAENAESFLTLVVDLAKINGATVEREAVRTVMRDVEAVMASTAHDGKNRIPVRLVQHDPITSLAVAQWGVAHSPQALFIVVDYVAVPSIKSLLNCIKTAMRDNKIPLLAATPNERYVDTVNRTLDTAERDVVLFVHADREDSRWTHIIDLVLSAKSRIYVMVTAV